MADMIAALGGSSAILLGVIGFAWKTLSKYNVSIVCDTPVDNLPSHSLECTWETTPESPHGAFRAGLHAKETPARTWHVTMKQGSGDAYVYTDVFNKPRPGEQRFLRVRLSNVPPDADISVLHKYWAGTSREFIESQYHPHKRTPLLPRSGVHVYEEPSLIDDRDVTKEQLGLHFNAASADYDVVIEEAYTRHKTSICHAGCCSVFYARKKEK